MSVINKLAWRHGVLTITAVTGILTACGGGDDAGDSPSVTTASSDSSSGNGGPTGGESPFSGLVECLREQGLDVTEPALGGPGGAPGGSIPDGSLPPDFSIPEGGFPGGGSIPPDFSIPEGGFPGGGSIPPDFSIPEGGAGGRPEGAFPGGGANLDPAFLASMLGLDGSDPDVTAAIESCSDQLG